MIKNIPVKKIFPHAISIIIFVLIASIYFLPQLQGKKLGSYDTNQHRSFSHESQVYKKKTGDVALWTNSIFSGMPTTLIGADSRGNLLLPIEPILHLGIPRPIGYWVMGMISFYILLIALGVNFKLAILGSIFFVFATGNISLFDAGHMTKIRTVFLSAPLLAGIIYIFKEKYLTGSILFSLSLALSIGATHVQMTYYLGMVVGIYVLMQVYNFLKEKKYAHLGKSLGIILVCTIIAMGVSFNHLSSTYQNGQSTMRGKAVLEKTDSHSSSSHKGLSWEYASSWSNGYIDLLSSYIPLVVGGSNKEILKDNSAFIKKYPQYKNQKLPLYWGGLPSTSGPFYFGAVVFFLFLLGALSLKGNIKWWLVSGVALTFIISLGHNLNIVNKTLFDYLPLYNNFRTPNSVLAVTGLFIPLLGILGLSQIVQDKDKAKYLKKVYISGGVLAGLALLLGLLGGAIFDFTSSSDNYLVQQIGPGTDELMQNTRKEYLQSTSFRTAFLIIISASLLHFYLKGKIKEAILILGIAVFGIFDLFSINKRYVNNDNFNVPRNMQGLYQPRDVDKQILTDTDIHYRVFDLSNDPWNYAISSYHHKLIGGYHPAKLQRYQDLIEYYLSKNNSNVLNMLNSKYVIYKDQQGKELVQLNNQAYGNAWFISNVELANSNNEEIEKLETNNARETAIVHNEFAPYLEGLNPSGSGSITLTSYSPMKLTYQSTSSTDQLAVFSEIWYQPGWKAYIDGELVDHIRANYVLRALKIPSGTHEIIFEYTGNPISISSFIGMISSVILLSFFIGFLFLKFKSFASSNLEEPKKIKMVKKVKKKK